MNVALSHQSNSVTSFVEVPMAEANQDLLPRGTKKWTDPLGCAAEKRCLESEVTKTNVGEWQMKHYQCYSLNS